MCTVMIAYYERALDTFEHIKEIQYVGNDRGMVVVPAKDLTTHLFPIGCPLWLLAEDRIFCVSCEQMRYIEIVAEA